MEDESGESGKGGTPPEDRVDNNQNGAGHTGPGQPAELLTPGEVADLFGVDPKTVTRWASAGKLDAQRTLGGHRRYRAREVYGLLGQHGGATRSRDGSFDAEDSSVDADSGN